MTTTYSGISPRTSAYVVKELLTRGMPFLIFEKFGQAKPIPAKNTKTISFRRYFLKTTGTWSPFAYFETDSDNNFSVSAKTLTEGVTPNAAELDYADYTATLVQVGDLVTISDVVLDTHEDNILKEATEILGEQAALIIEKMRFNTLIAGSNVFYGAGAARTAVNAKYTLLLQRKLTRTLKRNLARPITNIVKSTPAYGTQAIQPSFVCVCHPDLDPDLRGISGWVASENYGQTSPMENEIGKIEDVRFITSTICEPFLGGGTSGGSNVLETGSIADVYPMLFFGKDAYGIVPFKGKNAVTPMVVNPTPSDSDPLGQRGHVSWKAMQATIILNDAWMARAEVAVTNLAA